MVAPNDSWDNAGAYAIRPAREADLVRLVELLLILQDHIEASNADLWRMKAQARERLRGQLAARLAAADVCVLVAEHAEAGVVGTISGRTVTNKRYTPALTGMVDQIVVQEGHRRVGVGSRLVAGLCSFFAEQGVDDISLRYVAGNEEAMRFWNSLGFSKRIVIVGAKRRVLEARLELLDGGQGCGVSHL
jgi:L-amino acid N-acyltransferase YncA